ncbi:MAG: RtcB family protein [Spirochaetia bacterium]|nr:RtcB family protein [Spirochaetota bacterium]MCX8096601.1 RtcB family protein [Spirochaetota bacterium]MDW8112048.1 RtcB family protein [Spirochaetia bacterium]
MKTTNIEMVNEYEWIYKRREGMNTNVRFFCSKEILEGMDDAVLTQAINVSYLPGIVGDVIVLPDAHWGYGFPIGSVTAFDENGVFTVGGVGFDINCGVRTLKTDLQLGRISKKDLELLSKKLFETIPAGLGKDGDIKLSKKELFKVLTEGVKWCLDNGYAEREDIENIEENGTVESAIPDYISEEAIEREKGQIGTLGSGNHYLEVQVVDEIYNRSIAEVFGLFEGQIVITIHTGSRGFGHQVNTDFIRIFLNAVEKYKIPIKEKELACAPIKSDEGRRYLGAVKCAINYAFANRQIITYLVRKVFKKVFRNTSVEILYDVGHNNVKEELHNIDGKRKKVFVHRKGSTRGFGPGTLGIPEKYSKTGQPVIVGGSMGSFSYILSGTDIAMEKTFGSTIHGAGRSLSRNQAKKNFPYEKIIKQLENRGITVLSSSKAGISEEAPQAYKDIDKVIESVSSSRISNKVARLRPIITIKG